MATRTGKTKSLDSLIIPAHILEYMERALQRSIFEGKTTRSVGGTRFKKEGMDWLSLVDDRGEKIEQPVTPRVTEDSQSFVSFVHQVSDEIIDSRSVSARVSDSTLGTEVRLEALREWIADDVQSAAAYLLTELERTDLEPVWRRIVIYAVDTIRFEDAAVRASLATALLHHAAELRQSSSPDDLPAAMCAIRRAGSIIPEDRVAELLPFLNRMGFVDTRLVALQAVVAIYSAAPPNRDLTTIADRAGDLAMKHWDLDVFQAGGISALAIEATLVATMLGCRQLSQIADLANAVSRRLLMKRLKTKLDAVASAWESNTVSSDQVAQLREIAGKLRVN